MIAFAILPALAAHPHLNYDSTGYLAPPSLHSGRLPVVPILYLMAGHDLEAILVIQACLGALCWTALLSETTRPGRLLVRAGATLAVLAVACATYVVNWYAALLSESISISLLALLFACLARGLRTRRSWWPAAITASAWALTRSTNAYIVLVAGLALLAYLSIRHRRQTPKAALVVAAALAGTILSLQGQLWQQPLRHTLIERVLPNSQLTAWFHHHGMPVTPLLQHLAGNDTPAVDDQLAHDPSLAPFRNWIDTSGKDVYAEFLATHPLWDLAGTFGPHEELSPTVITYYGGGVNRTWYPALPRNLLLSQRQSSVLALYLLCLAHCSQAIFRRAWTSQHTLWVVALQLGLASLIIDSSGDSWEVGRHSIEGTLIVALAGIMLLGDRSGVPRPGTRQYVSIEALDAPNDTVSSPPEAAEACRPYSSLATSSDKAKLTLWARVGTTSDERVSGPLHLMPDRDV